MKKVYAVSSGYYSDYRVNAIFSTKELAEEFKRLIPDEKYNDIEEYELDPVTADNVKRGYSVYSIYMLKDGSVEHVEKKDNGFYKEIGHELWKRSEASLYHGKKMPDVLTSIVWAKTEEHAIKIVNEHRTQMIANGQWKINT